MNDLDNIDSCLRLNGTFNNEKNFCKDLNNQSKKLLCQKFDKKIINKNNKTYCLNYLIKPKLFLYDVSSTNAIIKLFLIIIILKTIIEVSINQT